jgi:hypothetical protein
MYYVITFHACISGCCCGCVGDEIPKRHYSCSYVAPPLHYSKPLASGLFVLRAVFDVFILILSTMVAIRREPGPPPQFHSEDSDSSVTVPSSSKVKALHQASHSPEHSSPLANGKSREVPRDGHHEDGSRDTVSYYIPYHRSCMLSLFISSSIGSSSNEEEQRGTKSQEWGKGTRVACNLVLVYLIVCPTETEKQELLPYRCSAALSLTIFHYLFLVRMPW